MAGVNKLFARGGAVETAGAVVDSFLKTDHRAPLGLTAHL